jgi:mono/diheme cytochrome c family protein
LRRAWVVTIVILVIALVSGDLALNRFSLTALPEPGRTETLFATKAKHFLIARGSRDSVHNEPPNTPARVTEGDKLYGTECAMCHGMDGRKASETGRWMYPRAADLTSAAAQGYSDRELFWIVKNGIRFSGMPAFGQVESEEHIWSLVHYVRSLNPTPGRTNNLSKK